MPDQPSPPNSLPKYLAEGVPKQNDQTLRELGTWIDELLTYRQEVSAEEIEVPADESIEAVEDTSDGTVVIKKVSCGKDGCKCQSGELHGPYKYIVKRQDGELSWEYEGPVER